MESGVPQRRLCGHPRRSAAASLRDRCPGRQKLSPQRGSGAHCPQNEVPRPGLAQDALSTMLQPNDLPLVCLPVDLSDEAAAKLLEFLQELTAALERHYGAQLKRYYDATD